jgi:protein-S-isoprenylcysteine O-methyltransferase Ste14
VFFLLDFGNLFCLTLFVQNFTTMKNQNHPGVYIPPPIIYAAFFVAGLLLQRLLPLPRVWFATTSARITGWGIIATAIIVFLPALARFAISKNTLITVKPARSLQTGGIYAYTRNPMYLGLLLLYTGIAALIGDWWVFIMIPFVVFIITQFVIRNEERYLQNRFNEEYLTYKNKVRRWL